MLKTFIKDYSKKCLSLLLVLVMLFSQAQIFSQSFAMENFTVKQDGTYLSWWQGRESAETDTYRDAAVEYIHITSGKYAGILAYCLQNRKDGPNNELFEALYAWNTGVYTNEWADGLQAILEYGYPNVSRPYGTLSDEEAYYATTQAVRFWVAENGSAYTYEFSDLSNFSISQLREYARTGQIPDKLYSINDQGNRALVASIELLSKARNKEQSVPTYSISNPQMTATVENGADMNHFVAYLTINMNNVDNYLIDITKLPTGTTITDNEGNNAFTGSRSGTYKITIPFYDKGGSSTENMTFKFPISFFASGPKAKGNIVLGQPVDQETDVNVQRIIFLTNENYLIGSSSASISTPTTLLDDGKLVVHKVDSKTGESIAGAKFGLLNPITGTYVNTEPYVTDANGVFETFVYPGSYILEELEGVPGYKFDKNNHPTIAVSINENDTTEISFKNIPIGNNPGGGGGGGTTTPGDSNFGVITINKVDAENTTTKAAGSARLDNGIYEVYAAEDINYVLGGSNRTYAKDQLVDTISSLEGNNSISLPYGNYYVVEKIAPTGYLVNVDLQNVTVNANIQTVTIKDNVIKNKIHLTKYMDTAVKPEANIDFKITRVDAEIDKDGKTYIKNYYESQTIKTGLDGKVSTSDIPYGYYYVEQLNTTEGYAFVDPFFVNLNSSTADYSYVLTDIAYKATLKITKVDSETGNPIKSDKACFNIYYKEESKNLQNVDNTENFCTNSEGILDISTPLTAGTYIVTEAVAPNGYFKSKDAETFKIDENTGSLDGTANIAITFKNTRIKGTIEISKTGQVLGSTSTSVYPDKVYYANGTSDNPIVTNLGFDYEQIEGATIVIKAKNNIVAPDGTLKFSAGDVVETIVSGKAPSFVSNLYLGDYTVEETIAPSGYVRDTNVYDISLTSTDSTIPVVSESKVISNNLIPSQINFLKVINKTLADGTIESVSVGIDNLFYFGIFTNQIFKVGTENVPKDTLVGIVKNNPEGAQFTLPAGNYYLKEIGYVGTDENVPKIENVGINTQIFDFSVDYSKTENNLVKPLINNGNAIVNTLSAYDVEISKKTEDENLAGNYTYLNGATLELRDANKNVVFTGITADDKGFTVKLIPGAYSLTELVAPSGYILNTTPSIFTVNSDGSVNGNPFVVDKQTSVTITKKNENGVGLAGAKFELYDSSNNKVLTTDSTTDSGTVTIKGLPIGEYTFKEVVAPDGYQLSSNTYKFTLNANGTITGDTEVIDFKVSVTLNKVDKESKEKLPGAVFEVYKKDVSEYIPENLVATGTTDENGKIVFTNIPAGEYKVIETKAPNGYIKNPKVDTFIVKNDNVVITVENEKIGLALSKTDSVSKDPVVGAIVKITGDGYSQEKTTDSNGLISLSGLKDGEYTFQEITAPTGYKLNSMSYKFTIKDGVVSGTTTFTNTPLEVTLYKKDAVSVLTISGATIAVYDKDNNEIYRGTGDGNGKFLLSKIPAGEYTFKEIIAPDGYILDTKVYSFEITTAGVFTGDDTILNERTSLTLVKQDDNGKPLAGVKFELTDEKGENPQEFITDDKGLVPLNNLNINTKYILTEKQTLDGYGLSDIKYVFTVNEDGKAVKEGTIVATNTILIKNSINKVVLDKQSTSGQYLKGAVFTVTGETLDYNQDFTTGDDGKITITGLLAGTYKLKEKSAPSGYNLNSNEYKFTIDKYGNVTGTTTIVNSPISSGGGGSDYTPSPKTTTVTIHKVDENGKALADAQFTFYRNGTKLYTKTTDKNGDIKLTGLINATYTYKEVKAPEGYLLDDSEYEFKVANSGVTGTLKVVNYKEKPFSVTLSKEDVNNGNLLANSKFEVTDSSGKVVGTFITDVYGQINLKDLKPGKYTFKEVSAPNGYAIDSNSYEFTITDNYKVTGTTKIADDVVRINILKTDNKNEPLANAKIGLFKKDSINPDYTTITGIDGTATFVNVKVGEYILREIAAPEGYVLSEKTYNISITDTHKNTKDVYVFVNNPKNTPPEKNEIHDTPKTSDNSPVLMLSGIIAISSIGLIFSLFKLRKKDD